MKLTPAKAAAILEEFLESEDLYITADERCVEAEYYLIGLGKRVSRDKGDTSFKKYKDKFSKEDLRKETRLKVGHAVQLIIQDRTGSADVAQMEEQMIRNHQVNGSSPFVGFTKIRE